jgi:predicted phage replisome organizer
MAEKKKYYWLRLKRDFFKRHDIQIIEGMPNGKDYILFYLKLLCESVDHEGNLRFSDEIPYNEQMLSTITNTNVDIVRTAIDVFSKLGMMDILDDGTFYMSGIEKLMGSETPEHIREQNRIRQQRYRDKKRLAMNEFEPAEALCNDLSRVTRNGEKEIEKEKDINNKYTCAFSEFWKNYPRKKEKSKAYKCYKARLNDGYTEDQLLTACINYAAECEHNKTEERYIKHGATFLSANEPFLDYLKGEEHGPVGNDNRQDKDRELEELATRLLDEERHTGMSDV